MLVGLHRHRQRQWRRQKLRWICGGYTLPEAEGDSVEERALQFRTAHRHCCGPVQIKQLSSGKALAWSRLAVKKSQKDTAWINLTFWDELAHVAFQHLEKGNQIYVSGRLISDTIESDDGEQKIYYKVVVQQINFSERSTSSVALYDRDSNAPTSGRKQNSHVANNPGSIEELWQAFFANPVECWDNRKTKVVVVIDKSTSSCSSAA